MRSTKHKTDPRSLQITVDDCVSHGVIVIVVLNAMFWFITGKIDLHYKGIYLEGAGARTVSVMLIVCLLTLYIAKLRNRMKSLWNKNSPK